MELKQILIKRISPLLLVLVVLLISVPVLPAEASTYDLTDTLWQFNSILSKPFWEGYLSEVILDVGFTFTSDTVFTDLYYSSSAGLLQAVTDRGNIVTIYNYNTSSWISSGFRSIYFTSAMSYSPAFYVWMTQNATVVSGDIGEPSDPGTPSLLTATFVIAGKSYTFPGTDTSLPEVCATLTNGILALTSGETRYYIELPGVVGVRVDPSVDFYFGIGESFTFPSSYSSSSYVQTLYPFYSTSAIYSTTVILYDYDGRLIDQYVFQGKGFSPDVDLHLTADLIQISCGDQIYTHRSPYSSFLGLSKTPASSVISYSIGFDYTLSGQTAANTVYELSLVTNSSGDISYDGIIEPGVTQVFSDFANFLIKPVSAFFNVQFIPGFTFGKLALVAFVLGLVFWIMKVSK